MSNKYQLTEDYGNFPEISHDELELIGKDREIILPLPRHKEKNYGTSCEFQAFPEFGFSKEDDGLTLIKNAS